jgi:thiamine biosynthesis lipoprotein ApbE
LEHVERRIEEEGERVAHYLDPKTRKPLISAVEKTLLEAHVDTILSKGTLYSFFLSKKKQEIDVFGLIDGL